ncbi:Cysteine protease ATG4A [Microtus ochrogaster]|uniref:Cysteine protease n=1 Tax=Microtus ochrogaster TaxID=79684 RepID=A0A8J6GIL6_MICOH|nr:Cysteine protease ATG4A [Microtus ochrogaster]
MSKYENQITIFTDYLEEFPDTDELVWILGKQHLLKTDSLLEVINDITETSELTAHCGKEFDLGEQNLCICICVCSFKHADDREKINLRNTFSCPSILPTGGTGPSSDAGWGCMLRCGQMMLAQALICRHLGREKMCCVLPVGADTADESPPASLTASNQCKGPSTMCPAWKPLLLIVPLRLGINQINPVYIEAFKECFKMPQSLGALGGKPNNAYYFIGFLGKKGWIASDELIFLDPHTTQTFVDTEESGIVDDQTFHCLQSPQRMSILNLDPSVALGFFCKEEKDFDNWCSLVQKEILKENLRMFELVQKHPSHWPPFVPPAKPEVTTTGAEFIDSTEHLEDFDLEEDFEILSV